MRKRVLVTGGAGFIGSHLCKQLLSLDCDVLCVDNYFTGSSFCSFALFFVERTCCAILKAEAKIYLCSRVSDGERE
jgi:nucleoside-diphosphate-sugar epimerase